MAIYRNDIIDIELETGTVFRSFLNHAIGKGDNMGNRYGMRLLRNGSPITLTDATCTGLFISPHGEHILISGTDYTGISGNTAWVQLPQACYNYEGQFVLSIKVTDPGVTETMRIIDGTVVNTGYDGAVAPVGSVPTYQEILNVYERLNQIAGEAKDQHGEGNANQVDGYHATELLVDMDGVERKLYLKTGRVDIHTAETLMHFSFVPAFPNDCLGVLLWPILSYYGNESVSVNSKDKDGFDVYLYSSIHEGGTYLYLAFGY